MPTHSNQTFGRKHCCSLCALVSRCGFSPQHALLKLAGHQTQRLILNRMNELDRFFVSSLTALVANNEEYQQLVACFVGARGHSSGAAFALVAIS